MVLLDAVPEELKHRFEAATTPEDVARMIEMSYSRLVYCVYVCPEETRYRTFTVRKRRGGLRVLSEPMRTLKIAQQRLNQVFQAVYLARPPVHGFIIERSILTNAQAHTRKRFVFNVDLEDFFPTINFGRVRGLFIKVPYKCTPRVATFLARLCCHANALPQGAPTSPIIANMICARMDAELQRLAKQYRCNYTRYADDITFSTSLQRFPSAIARLEGNFSPAQIVTGHELAGIIERNGFRVNASKTRLRRPFSRQDVTGVVTNRFPNVPRDLVRQVRAMLYAWDRFGLAAAQQDFVNRYDHKDRSGFERRLDFAAVVKGKIDHIAMIRGKSDSIVQSLYQRYAEVNPAYQPRPAQRPTARLHESLWVLECRTSGAQGSAFMLEGYGLVTCQHVLGPDTVAFRPDDFTRTFEVQVETAVPALDVAILTIQVPNPRALRKARSDLLHVGSSLTIAGFPNYRFGDTGWVSAGAVAGFRVVSTVRRILVNTPIVAGASGGPVLDGEGRVIGIAATGADRIENADATEHHGVIPIETLDVARDLMRNAME
jgi:RNA-directed DNA polymerase